MATIDTRGGGVYGGFPERLQAPGEDGICNNGRPAVAYAMARLEKACQMLAARRKCTVPAVKSLMKTTYTAGDLTEPLLYLPKEMYSSTASAFGLFETIANTSSDRADVRAFVGLSADGGSTWSESLSLAAYDDSRVIFRIPPFEIGDGDAADLELIEIQIRIRWDSGAGTDQFRVHSVTLTPEAMDEITT